MDFMKVEPNHEFTSLYLNRIMARNVTCKILTMTLKLRSSFQRDHDSVPWRKKPSKIKTIFG